MISKVLLLFSILVGSVALLGDLLLSFLSKRWHLAFFDNLTHVLVAFFTWITIEFSNYNPVTNTIIEAMVCGTLASLLDTDHFIAASSWRLLDATSLKIRPFLHNSTLIIVIFATTLSLSLLCAFPALWKLSWIFLAAGLSHHIRDATRRGFWFWPMGCTPAVPYVCYIALQIAFPHIIRNMMKLTPKPHIEEVRIEMV